MLLAHRHLPARALIQAMRQAVDAGMTDPAVVVVEARRIAGHQPAAQVIPIGALARFDRPGRSWSATTPCLTSRPAVNQATSMVGPALPGGRRDPGRRHRPGREGGHVKSMTEQAAEAAIRVACHELHLPTIAEEGSRIADDATRQRLTHRGFLAEVLAAEIDERALACSSRSPWTAAQPVPFGLQVGDPLPQPGLLTAQLLFTLPQLGILVGQQHQQPRVHWRAAHGIGIGCLSRCGSAPSATTDIRHDGYKFAQAVSKPR